MALFRIIEGGLGSSYGKQGESDTRAGVAAEGRRRLIQAGVDRYEARERIAGIPVPGAVKHFKLQVEFAVETLSTLDPLPADFMLDGYWPSMGNGSPR